MLVGRELRPRTYSWGNAETILYALGVGAAPPRDLPLLFEGAGPLVLPTFGTVTTGIAFLDMIDELQIELGAILHGEQTIVLHRPLPPTGSVSIRRRVENVWDKGGGAVVVVEEEAVDDSPMFSSSSSWFVKGAGGFGGDRGPSASSVPDAPDRAPDIQVQRTIRAEQAALYRLSGDLNAIHIDPASAVAAGFDGTFIHGLCTFGMVGLELLMEVAGGQAERVREVAGRFVSPVRHGDVLSIELWRSGPDAAVMRASVEGRVVMAGGHARFGEP